MPGSARIPNFDGNGKLVKDVMPDQSDVYASIAARPINLADRGVSPINGPDVNTPLLKQAIADAEVAGSGVVVPWTSSSAYIDINDVIPIASGHISLTGLGKVSRIRQTVLPKPVFEISGPDVTVQDLYLAGEAFDYTGQTASFRGETLQGYASGLWIAASRVSVARVTVENMVSAVQHTNWDAVANAEGPALTGCSVEDLYVIDCNFGLVPRGVQGFAFRAVRGSYKILPGCTLSPHLVYFTTGPVTNADVVGSDCSAKCDSTANGYYAYQIKNTVGGNFSGLHADGCPGGLHVMSSQDLRFVNVQSLNDTATDTAAGCISLEGTNTRIKMRGVTITQAAGGGMAVWTDGTDTDTLLADAQIICNHTSAGPSEVYDVSMRGTNPVLDNVKVSNIGTATYDSAIGVWGGANCEIRNPVASGEKRALRFRSGTGHSAFYRATALSMDSATAVKLIDDLTGAELYARQMGWTAYSPTLAGTGAALGNATVVARYIQDGKTVNFRVRITRGSTTTWGTSGVQISLPVAAKTDTDQAITGKLFRTGANYYFLWGDSGTSTTVRPFTIGASGVAGVITDTAPAAAVTGDYIDVRGTYEAA